MRRTPACRKKAAARAGGNDTRPNDTVVSLGRLDDFLRFRMRRVHSLLSRDFFAATREWNLREGMFSALELIAANPGISQARVSEEIGLDRSSMVMVMDELENRAWAKRERCSQDRRRHRLCITPAGSKVLDALFLRMEEAEARVVGTLDAKDLAAVRRALDRIYEASASSDAATTAGVVARSRPKLASSRPAR